MTRPLTHLVCLMLCLALVACGEDRGRLPRSDSGSPSGGNSREGEASPGAQRPQASSSEHGALRWVPRDALAVARIPRLGDLDVLGRTAFARLMREFDVDLEAKLAPLFKRAVRKMPLLKDAWELTTRLEGEATLALLEVYPDSFRRPRRDTIPFSALAWIELGALEEDFVTFMARVDEAADGYEGYERHDARHLSLTEDGATMHFIASEGWLCMHVGPAAVDETPLRWRELAAKDSFAAASVSQGSPMGEDGETVYLEGHLNLEPVWPLIKMAAPPEARKIMSALKLEALHGVSLIAGVDSEARFHDRFVLHSPSGEDVVSRFLSQPTLEPALAQRVAPEAHSTFLFNFDAQRTLATIRGMLPRRQQSLMDGGLRRLQRMTGMKLEQDILSAFGTGYVVSLTGDPFAAAAGEGTFEAALAVEVRDVKRARIVIDKIMKRLDPGAARLVSASKPGLRTLPFSDGPDWLKPAWEFAGETLVIGTSPSAVRAITRATASGATGQAAAEALKAAPRGTWAWAHRSTQSEIRMLHGLVSQVMEQSGLLSLGGFGGMGGLRRSTLPSWEKIEPLVRDLPPGEMNFRRTAQGFVMEGRNVLPNLFVGAAPVALMAAVALPNLLSARVSANEAAAIATLRNLCSAQAQFQASAAADRDGDGCGEYGFFGEMSGSTPLPSGERLNPPVLSRRFAECTQGCVIRSGYVFRIHLLGDGPESIAARADGGAPDTLDANLAESGFIVYAWPKEYGETGKRAFMVDSSGDVVATFNDQMNQRYSGLEKAPELNAARQRPGKARHRNRTQDGGFWMTVR